VLDIQGKVHRFPRLMPEVWYEVVFKDGKRAVKARALLNSGSSFVVLPSKLAQKLELKPAGRAEIELADGKVLEREVYEIEVEMKNEQTGERRSGRVWQLWRKGTIHSSGRT